MITIKFAISRGHVNKPPTKLRNYYNYFGVKNWQELFETAIRFGGIIELRVIIKILPIFLLSQVWQHLRTFKSVWDKLSLFNLAGNFNVPVLPHSSDRVHLICLWCVVQYLSYLSYFFGVQFKILQRRAFFLSKTIRAWCIRCVSR